MDPNEKSRRLPLRLKRLYLLQSALVDDVLKAHGLGRSQWLALSRVREAGELPQRELQELMHVESATLTGIVDVLVSKGWLERISSPTDKRARVLRLTAEGERRWGAVPDPIDMAEACTTEGMSAEDREGMARCVEQMIANLERRQKGARSANA
jgi:DNA-binding MarR family transcriptional regulator